MDNKRDELRRVAEFMFKYKNRPIDFAQKFYFDHHPKYKKPDKNQCDLLESICFNKGTSAISGTGTGKTSALTIGAAQFIMTRPLSFALVTGPKFEQIKDAFWNEFRRWNLYSPLGKFFNIGSDKIRLAYADELYGGDADMWCIMARTCKEPQNLAGLHAEDSLFICDEASAIDDLIYEVIEGNLTKPENKIILTGQPQKTNGYYFDSQNKNKDLWNCLHFDSETSEISDKAYNQRMKKKYGENSDVYRVRVKGLFPLGNNKAIMQYEDVQKAINRILDKISGPFELGVDVARFGDDLTVIAIRQGNKLYPLKIFSKLGTTQVAAQVIATVREYRKITGYTGQVKIKIDDTGIGGGVTDILKAHKGDYIDEDNKQANDKLVVIPINFGGSAQDKRYPNMASKLWFEMANQLPYLELPNDDSLAEELSTRRKANHPSGLLMVESKDAYKEEYGSSPDRADATILSFASGANPKRVWPAFHSWESKQCRNFLIKWSQLLRRNAQVYVTMYQEKDFTTSALLCIWDGQDGKLYVLNEVISSNPRPENIVPRLQQIVHFYNMTQKDITPLKLNKFLWYANQEMFGLAEKATSMKGMRDGSAIAFEQPEYGLFLQPNLAFDRPGAMAIAGSMLAANMIVMHSDNCKDTISQSEDWVIENGKPVMDNCGACMALCNIVSLLHQWGKTNKFMPKMAPYSAVKEYSLKTINEADMSGTLTELEAKKRGIILPRIGKPKILTGR